MDSLSKASNLEIDNAPPVLWDVQACAAYLGKSPRWIWSALTRRPEEPGSIPHVRIGRTPRFLQSDIAEWVRHGCPPAATFNGWKASPSKRPQTT